jgi:hypothetical protein
MFQSPEIPTGCGVLVGFVVVVGVVVGVVVVVVVRVGRFRLCTEVWVSALTAVSLDAAFVPAWCICLW